LTSDTQARLRAYTELAASILEHREKITRDHQFLFKEITQREVFLNKIIEKLPAQEQNKYRDAIDLAKQRLITVVGQGLEITGELISPILNSDHFGAIEIISEIDETCPPFSSSPMISPSREEQRESVKQTLNKAVSALTRRFSFFFPNKAD
jgi:hypothetical protein